MHTNSLPSHSCVIYDGSLCSSVFGQANITAPSSFTRAYNTTISATIAAQEILLRANIEQFSAVQDQDCLNYVLFIACLVVYRPCPGSAWCGVNSRDELRSAVASACRCSRDDSCVVNSNGVMFTADALITALTTLINNTTLPDYYLGASPLGLSVTAMPCARM